MYYRELQMNDDEADKIIERLAKTSREIRMEEIMSILTNTSQDEYSNREIQLLIMEYVELGKKGYE